MKNVKDGISRPLGSKEIKKKSGHSFAGHPVCIVFAKLGPAQSNSNSVGWAEIALISTPRESTELSSVQLNPTPTQLVGLIGSRISLKPA